jgi:hypothetical protein
MKRCFSAVCDLFSFLAYFPLKTDSIFYISPNVQEQNLSHLLQIVVTSPVCSFSLPWSQTFSLQNSGFYHMPSGSAQQGSENIMVQELSLLFLHIGCNCHFYECSLAKIVTYFQAIEGSAEFNPTICSKKTKNNNNKKKKKRRTY